VKNLFASVAVIGLLSTGGVQASTELTTFEDFGEAIAGAKVVATLCAQSNILDDAQDLENSLKAKMTLDQRRDFELLILSRFGLYLAEWQNCDQALDGYLEKFG
jgi:hypothetical protein